MSVDLSRDQVDELRSALVEEEAESFRLADDLAAELALMPASSLPPKVADLVDRYKRSRGYARTLRRVIAVEVAG